MFWLLDKAVLDDISYALETGFEPSAAQHGAFNALTGEITTLDGSTATIHIKGVLTPEKNIMAMIFGGGNTTYTDIITAIKAADDDSSISNIDLMIDSPGGQIDGLFEAMDAVRSTTTPVRSVVVNRATSAAYGLAAQANSIVALNRASSVGSIGVVTQGRVDSSIITITSSNAPFKRPDISTESGRAVVRKELDDLENLFIQAIANGRDLTQHMVIADYGKGATYLAAEAMRRGMIDAIGVNSPTDNVVTNTPKPVVNNRQNGPFNQQQKANNAMNITELKAEHPALYEQVFALGFKDGNSEGQADERKRVNAHLKLGGRFNAMTTALKAIAEGVSTNDAEVNADYMCAMADARDLAASQADADANNAGKLGDDPATEETTEAKDKRASENILKFAAEKLGIELPVEA